MNYPADQIILTNGGLEGLYKILLAAQLMNRAQTELIFPAPGFTPVIAQADLLHIPVISVQTKGNTGYCLTADDLKRTLKKKNETVSVLYTTPANNPTSTVYNGKTYSELLHAFINLRPNGIIIADIAYLDMIDDARANKIIRCIKDKSVNQSVVVLLSMSKIFGYPHLRCAALYTADPKQYDLFFKLNQTMNASLPGPMELEAFALWNFINKRTRIKMYNLFRSRQKKLIIRFKTINEERIKNNLPPLIDEKFIYTDIPLYIYAKLTPQTAFLDFFIETGLGGVPGTTFGDNEKENMIRFAVGTEAII